MFLISVFGVSGVVVAVLIFLKMRELSTGRQSSVLGLISRSDHSFREKSHTFLLRYTDVKERMKFFLEKKLPLHAKNTYNKLRIVVGERIQKYAGNIRNSKFLKKNDGMSEFFKSMSEREKGGKIDEPLEHPDDYISRNSENTVE